MRFIDTNILLYAVSRLPIEAGKRSMAHSVLDRQDCAFSIQVFTEFYAQATRATRIGALTHDEAAAMIAVWRRFPVQQQSAELLDRALELRARTGFSIWDCAIVAAAIMLGCHTLLSEDMHHGQVIDGVRIVNPFI